MTEKMRTVFGHEIDFSEIEGIDMGEILRVEQDLLKVDNGDPNYTYGWMNTRDPACAIKLRKGLWELVTPDTDPQILSGGAWDDQRKEYRVNELVLVRMPIRRWKALQAAAVANAARREAAVQAQFGDRVGEAMQRMGASPSKAAATLQEDEVIRKGRVERKEGGVLVDSFDK
jgi:hypothetical protein